MRTGNRYQVGGDGSIFLYPREGPPVSIRVGDTIKLKSPDLKIFWGVAGGSANYYLVEVIEGKQAGKTGLINRRHFDSEALKLINP